MPLFWPLNTYKTSLIFARAFVLIFFWVVCFPSQASESDKTDLSSLLQNYLEENNISGGVVLVEAQDINLEVAAGISDQSKNIVMTTDKRFYLASLGKTMVAAAILDAVSKKELKLDSYVIDLLRNSNGLEQLKGIKTVKVGQLLNHTSGLAEYFEDPFWNASLNEPDRKWRAEEAISFAYNRPNEFKPGIKFRYTNTNYVLLGMILESLDGSLSDALKKRVFTPSGMITATVGADPKDKTLAHGYNELSVDNSKIAWLSPLGDGPVVSSIIGVRRFVDALLKEKILVDTKRLSLMLKGSQREKSYGLGIEIESDEFGKWYGHSGGIEGFEADFRYYPEHDLTIAYAVNGNQIEGEALSDLIAQWYFGK